MDISYLADDEPDGWHEVTFKGERFRCGFDEPDPLEIQSVERRSFDFRLQVLEEQQELDAIREQFGLSDLGEGEAPADRLSEDEMRDYERALAKIEGADVRGLDEKVDWIADQVTVVEPVEGADPLTFRGETDWSSFPGEVREAIVRRLGVGQIMDLYRAIITCNGLEEAEKKS